MDTFEREDNRPVSQPMTGGMVENPLGGKMPPERQRGETGPESPSDLEHGQVEVNPLGVPDAVDGGAASRQLRHVTASRRGDDASGDGQIVEPLDALDAHGALLQLAVADRGVRGAFLSFRSSCAQEAATELPLAFANIERDGPTLRVTVHAEVHPSCAHKGAPVSFTCGAAAEAEAMQRQMEHRSRPRTGGTGASPRASCATSRNGGRRRASGARA